MHHSTHLYSLQKAFTLVELMIVIAIIGILAAALFPSMSNYIDRAGNRAIIEEIRKASIAANLDFNDFGSYASDIMPSSCKLGSATYTPISNPRWVTNGLYPAEKWNNAPSKYKPGWCFDWNYWTHVGGMAQIAILDVDSTGIIGTRKAQCLQNGRTSTGVETVCNNVGIDN